MLVIASGLKVDRNGPTVGEDGLHPGVAAVGPRRAHAGSPQQRFLPSGRRNVRGRGRHRTQAGALMRASSLSPAATSWTTDSTSAGTVSEVCATDDRALVSVGCSRPQSGHRLSGSQPKRDMSQFLPATRVRRQGANLCHGGLLVALAYSVGAGDCLVSSAYPLHSASGSGQAAGPRQSLEPATPTWLQFPHWRPSRRSTARRRPSPPRTSRCWRSSRPSPRSRSPARPCWRWSRTG